MWTLFNGDKVVAKEQKRNGTPYLVATEEAGTYELPLELFYPGVREVTVYELFNWASDRCFPPERLGADKLLKSLGLERYDGFMIAEKTKGRLMTDNFWFDCIGQ